MGSQLHPSLPPPFPHRPSFRRQQVSESGQAQELLCQSWQVPPEQREVVLQLLLPQLLALEVLVVAVDPPPLSSLRRPYRRSRGPLLRRLCPRPPRQALARGAG